MPTDSKSDRRSASSGAAVTRRLHSANAAASTNAFMLSKHGIGAAVRIRVLSSNAATSSNALEAKVATAFGAAVRRRVLLSSGRTPVYA